MPKGKKRPRSLRSLVLASLKAIEKPISPHNFECCHFVGPEPVRVVQCQSPCGPTADMALHEHLPEAEREGLDEESARIGKMGAQNMRFRHACSFFRSFPAPHAPSPAVPYDLTTARELTRTPQPHYNILQMIEEELVDKSMRSGRSYHRIVENVFFFVGTILVHEARWPRTCSRPCAFGKKTKKKNTKKSRRTQNTPRNKPTAARRPRPPRDGVR